MTTKQIEQRIKEIHDIAGDSEAAHSKEDALRAEFIEYVATLEVPLGKKAQLILTTDKLKFNRWTA